MKLLIVDDDLDLRELIGFALRQAGYLVVKAADGLEALQVWEQEQPDLVILDVNLPKLNGWEVCRRIRAETNTPIMMLTVRNSEEEQVQGLDLGADDYLTKPFSPRMLLARVRALLRRVEVERPAPQNVGAFQLDLEQQMVRVGSNTPTRLTNLEFRLLQYLLANAGHTITVERLTNHVWGYRGVGDRQLLKQLVHRLRQKLEVNPAEPHHLLTVAGVGYVLKTNPASSR
jgi:DNA-binding response OmpR family regulator